MVDVSRFKKALAKKDRYNIGLSPVVDWISTGNSGLNYIISGDMSRGIAVGRQTAIAGLQGSGKSFILSNIIREAQNKGYFTIYVDTEYATSDGFMEKIGVDLDENKFMAVQTATIDDTTEFFSDLLKNTEKEDKILFAIDSLSNLQPERDIQKFEDGKQAFNQGLREKLLKQLAVNMNSKCGNRNMAIVWTCHEYVNGSDVYGNPILKPNVGEGTLYIPSSVVELKKKDLKEGKEVTGISIKATMKKTRFTKLGSTCDFDLPWDTGMDFYDGALDVLEETGFVNKNAAWYSYVDSSGETVKFQRSNFSDHADHLISLYSESVGEVTEKDEGEVALEEVGK